MKAALTFLLILVAIAFIALGVIGLRSLHAVGLSITPNFMSYPELRLVSIGLLDSDGSANIDATQFAQQIRNRLLLTILVGICFVFFACYIGLSNANSSTPRSRKH